MALCRLSVCYTSANSELPILTLLQVSIKSIDYFYHNMPKGVRKSYKNQRRRLIYFSMLHNFMDNTSSYYFKLFIVCISLAFARLIFLRQYRIVFSNFHY